MSNASTLNLADLYDYIADVSIREPEALRALREETARDELARMQIAPEQGQFMALLIRLMGARNAIEIGTFTGYSAICIATALPDDGKLVTCDLNQEWTDIAKRYWAKTGVAAKIELHLRPALDTLAELMDTEPAESYDFAFIDADKHHYDHYYEGCLKLIRPGGLIAIDNVLWGGRVADDNVRDDDTVAIRDLTESSRTTTESI